MPRTIAVGRLLSVGRSLAVARRLRVQLLLDRLVAYWSLEEASGSRADSFGGNTLTDNNTVTQNPGIIGNAAQFTAANSEYLSRADNADLSTGDIDFTIATWVLLDSKTAGQAMVSKWNSGTNQREYLIAYDSGSDRIRFLVSNNGSSTIILPATVLGSPAITTWYFVLAWHDSIANTINIQVNNGTVNSASHTTGVLSGTSAFGLGALQALTTYMNGRIDEVGFWKRVLNGGERAWLYNAGAGRSYAEIVAHG